MRAAWFWQCCKWDTEYRSVTHRRLLGSSKTGCQQNLSFCQSWVSQSPFKFYQWDINYFAVQLGIIIWYNRICSVLTRLSLGILYQITIRKLNWFYGKLFYLYKCKRQIKTCFDACKHWEFSFYSVYIAEPVIMTARSIIEGLIESPGQPRDLRFRTLQIDHHK